MLFSDSLHPKNFSYLFLSSLLSVIIVSYQCPLCYGQTEIYQRALKEYNVHHYKEAALLFDGFISSQLHSELPLSGQLPASSDKSLLVYSILCEAVCVEQTGNYNEAAMIYTTLAERYDR